MAVIINELEVVVENQQAAQSAGAAAVPAAQSLEPIDVLDIEERSKLYRLRLLAH
jgi:hypothetical protein